MMLIDVVTIFPEFFAGPLQLSIVGRARQAGIVQVQRHDLRDWTTDDHRTVDDAPYGGGPGMVMKPEPLFAAIEALRGHPAPPVICFTPQGEPLTQSTVQYLARHRHLIMVCDRYEGTDERVREALVTDEISLGDFVVSGGELPALVLIDAIVRLLPGSVGNEESPARDSFSDGLLEHPHFTRPAQFRAMDVPDELVRGDHAAVASWRRRQSLKRTYQRRPDLLASADLSQEDYDFLAELMADAR